MNNRIHIIYTRFNIPLNNIHKTKKNEVVLTNKWHKQRIRLFEKYCLPSILNQTTKCFSWLIFVDENSPTWIKDSLSELTKLHQYIFLIYVSDENDMINSLIKFSQDFTLIDDFILNRFDNDDALHCSAIEKIQNTLPKSGFKILNMVKGYNYNINRKLLFEIELKSGPFYSLAINKKNIENKRFILGSHQNINHQKSIIENENNLWCQIIHNKNVSNHSHGVIISDLNILKEFGIHQKNTSLMMFSFNYLLHIFWDKPFLFVLKHMKNVYGLYLDKTNK